MKLFIQINYMYTKLQLHKNFILLVITKTIKIVDLKSIKQFE